MRNIKIFLGSEGSRLFSTASVTCRPVGHKGARSNAGGGQTRLNPTTILEDEQKGVFRALDIGRTKKAARTKDRQQVMRELSRQESPPHRADTMKPDQDWGSVWPAARTFHPSVVPLPVRQGVVQTKSQVIPSKFANAELMKTPNFLHLTPPVIKRHCEAIKKFCTPWPSQLQLDQDVDKHFPVEVITSDYLNASSSIRDRRARIVCTKFRLASMELDEHARDKFIRLVGDRYDASNDEVTLVVDRCPYRGQNLEYSEYLITALYFESWTKEDWENKEDADKELFEWELSKLKERVQGVEEDNLTEYREAVSKLLNKGEDDLSLRNYKEKVLGMLKLPGDIIQPDVEEEIMSSHGDVMQDDTRHRHSPFVDEVKPRDDDNIKDVT